MKVRNMAVAAVSVGMLMTSVAPASAQQFGVGGSCSVTQDAYGPGICPPPPRAYYEPKDPDPRLPFTGAEAGLIGGGGLLLLLGGLGMRRASRPQRF